MEDVQFAALQDAIPVDSVTLLSAEDPRLYRLVGQDFRNVVEVYLNDRLSPSFMVESETSLVAEAPEGMADTLLTVFVLSSSITFTEQSLFRLQFSPAPVRGLYRMAQKFVKLMLTTPERDVFHPDLGGNLNDLVGRAAPPTDSSELSAEFRVLIGRVEDQMIEIQTDMPGLDVEERLVSAEILSVSFDPQSTTFQGRVKLNTLAGETALLNLAL